MASGKPSKRNTGTREHSESLEQSLKQLEKIVETLEGGEITLDDSMKLYEEGVELSKKCLEKLSQTELKLKRLSKDIQGNFHLLGEEADE